MSVYVDDSQHGFGRMKMCHMLADSRAELDAIADKIGVRRKWIQHSGTYKEHYDICMSKRALAVAAGAIEITQKELGLLLRKRAKEKQHAPSVHGLPARNQVPPSS